MQLTVRQIAEISCANALAERAVFSVIQENIDSADYRLTQSDIDAVARWLDTRAEEARVRFVNPQPPELDWIEPETQEQRAAQYDRDCALHNDASAWLCRLARASGNHTPDFWLD